MKTCRYCRREDLHNDAIRCPNCGTWLSVRRAFIPLGKVVAAVFILVFLFALASCAVGAGIVAAFD